MFTLPTKKTKPGDSGHFSSLPVVGFYHPEKTLPGSVTELQGEIKEATKRLSDLQKSSNELKMDRQALGSWEPWELWAWEKHGRSVAFYGW